MTRIIVAVTNDLAGDNRVHKVCTTLSENGYDVLLVGRRFAKTQPLGPRSYSTHRFRLLFRTGPLFYLAYNIRLLFFLLRKKPAILLANDLDTLPAMAAAAALKGCKLAYDSHEYFTEVPELINRRWVRGIWLWLERRLVPRVDSAYTVCRSIASAYTKAYSVNFEVIHNYPNIRKNRGRRPVTEGKPFILYQGALNQGRGLEHAIAAMQYLPEARLIIAGGGYLKKRLLEIADGVQTGNVEFIGRLPVEELTKITRKAALGISIEEDIGLNYRYALPNKLFDYIQSGIPVVVSKLPEMQKVVEKYDIGLIAESHQPEELATVFRQALFNQRLRSRWQTGLKEASSSLIWENEVPKLLKIFDTLRSNLKKPTKKATPKA